MDAAVSSFVALVKEIGWPGAVLIFVAITLTRWGYKVGVFLRDKLFSEEKTPDGKVKGLVTQAANAHISLIGSLEKGLELIINQQEETHQSLLEFAAATRQSVAAIDKSVEAIAVAVKGQQRLEEQRTFVQPPSGILVENTPHHTHKKHHSESIHDEDS